MYSVYYLLLDTIGNFWAHVSRLDLDTVKCHEIDLIHQITKNRAIVVV